MSYKGKGIARHAHDMSKVALAASSFLPAFLSPVAAYADVTLGGTTIHGYTPSDMVGVEGQTTSMDRLSQLPSKIEQLVIMFVKYMLPFMAIGAVCIIIYNAIANIFRAEPSDNSDPTRKKKVPMKKVLKDICVCFFFVLFSWILVELIIYVLLGTEVFVSSYLL